MKKLLVLAGVLLAGCSESSRTILVPTFEERTISGERLREQAPLVVPQDYRNPTLHPPKEDTVVKEYLKNNFVGQTNSSSRPSNKDLTVPKDLLPPKRPCSLGNAPGCVK